jgi:hypothetical protein
MDEKSNRATFVYTTYIQATPEDAPNPIDVWFAAIRPGRTDCRGGRPVSRCRASPVGTRDRHPMTA